MVLKRLKLHH